MPEGFRARARSPSGTFTPAVRVRPRRVTARTPAVRVRPGGGDVGVEHVETEDHQERREVDGGNSGRTDGAHQPRAAARRLAGQLRQTPQITGSVLTDHRQVLPLAEAVDAVVVSVEYRLAPEHPDPAPVEDRYAALLWMSRNASALGIDPGRLALYGGSAGGGLAAGVALLARDRGGPHLAFQMLPYPMLDDRNTTPSSHEITDIGIWDRAANLQGWQSLLGDRLGSPRGGAGKVLLPSRWCSGSASGTDGR
ncbi:alpha/beta hydrolase fold domain-containing protein [Streptomyces scabiei]|uniref:alpha/beta hydrolase fold domain-containing protein n=1 Tax=Streptomyces scabiei TaxID=1930 RepID=UPI00099F2444